MSRLPLAALFTLVLSAAAAAQATESRAPRPPVPVPFVGLAHLEFELTRASLVARVHNSEPGFLGAVLLSTSPATVQYLVDLPPILADFVVMGVGTSTGQELEIEVMTVGWAVDLVLHGQALTVDATGLSASGIVQVDAQ